MTEKTDRTISFEVKEHIGVVATYSSGWSKELNLIAWNGAAPKYDIRDWDETHTHMSKGVTLFEGEMQTLMDIYVQAKNRRVFEEAKKQREARAREIEDGRKAYAERKAALDRAIAARDEAGEESAGAEPEQAKPDAEEKPVQTQSAAKAEPERMQAPPPRMMTTVSQSSRSAAMASRAAMMLLSVRSPCMTAGKSRVTKR